MTERAKPFVAWMRKGAILNGEDGCLDGRIVSADDGGHVPVVVTPLLPDDPRPGEVWERTGKYGGRVTVLSAPILDSSGYGGDLWVATDKGHFRLAELRRKPALKTFTLATGIMGAAGAYTVRAESREAALAKLSASLEEV